MVRRTTAREKRRSIDRSAQMYAAFKWRAVLLAMMSCAECSSRSTSAGKTQPLPRTLVGHGMAGPADSEGAAPAQDRSATGQTPEVVLTQEEVLTEEEVSVVAVVVLTEAVVAASVEEADLTNRPLT